MAGNVKEKKILKIIAFITMIIDHIGAGFLAYYIRYKGAYLDPQVLKTIYSLYRFLRAVGRTAFPLFCFLLVEGCLCTRNRRAYLKRLFIFAVLSEVPFDLMIHNAVFTNEGQNVLWTLLLGALMICLFEHIKSREDMFHTQSGGMVLSPATVLIIKYCIAIALTGITWYFKTDYKTSGIPLIFILYMFRDNRMFKSLAGYIVFYTLTEKVWSFPAFILIYFCRSAGVLYGSRQFNTLDLQMTEGVNKSETGNDKDGPVNKKSMWLYPDYLVYPVHMLMIHLMAWVFIMKK